MPQYRIFAGLGGGFGGESEQCIAECANLADAETKAYEEACQIFESYEGCGMDGWTEFMAEAEGYVDREEFEDEDDYSNALEAYAQQLENDARESWIEYHAVLVGSEEDTDFEIEEEEE